MIYKNFLTILLEAPPEEVRKYYPGLTDEEYNKIVASDPTGSPERLGNLARLVLDLYKRDRFDFNNPDVLHDIYQAFDIWMRRKASLRDDYEKFKNIKEIVDVETLLDVKYWLDTNASKKIKVSAEDKEKLNAEKIFDDENWEVWIPFDYKASVILGRRCQANWCTASSDAATMFGQYSTVGDLYIFVNKKPTGSDDVAYQYSDGKDEFRNNKNIEIISWENFKTKYYDLRPVFQFIANERKKIESSDQYKIERWVDRYKKSGSEYLLLKIAGETYYNHPEIYDSLNIPTRIEKQKIQIGDDSFTTIDAEKKLSAYSAGKITDRLIIDTTGDLIVSDKTTNMYGIVSPDGEILVPCKYKIIKIPGKEAPWHKSKNQSLVIYQDDESGDHISSGLMQSKRPYKIVVPTVYKSISNQGSNLNLYNNNVYEVKTWDNKYGIVDSAGKIIIPAIYKSISTVFYTAGFYLAHGSNSTEGNVLYDGEGTLISVGVFDIQSISQIDDIVQLSTEDGNEIWRLLRTSKNKNYKRIVTSHNEIEHHFLDDGLLVFVVTDGNKKGVVDSDGIVVFEPKYTNIDVEKYPNNKVTAIDMSGNKVIQHIKSFESGTRVWVNLGTK
jgi:hypothetical protein